jgi:hypothetical protein
MSRQGSRSAHSLLQAYGQQDLQSGQVAEGGEDGEVEGPFDELRAPDDGVSRLDLGSVRLPVPEGAQLQVEVEPTGSVRAVHVLTEAGQLTVTAFAAPRSAGLWREVAAEIVGQLRGDGARVSELAGEWGTEVQAIAGQTCVRFVGVDGPRWMLRGVAAGPPHRFEALLKQLYDLVRGTVVVRGAEPMPVRSALPVSLPQDMAEQLESVAAQRGYPTN